MPLCPKKLGVFRAGDTVRHTGEDVDLVWKGLAALRWHEAKGLKAEGFWREFVDPFVQKSVGNL